MLALRTVLPRPQPVLFVILALLGASILVVYLQHRALTTLERQTHILLQEMSKNTAVRIAADIRRTFDAPVAETLNAVNHPLLSAGRLDMVAEEFAEGLRVYPHIERFFIWDRLTEDHAPGEVFFFGGEPRGGPRQRLEVSTGGPLAGFYRDPAAGRAIYDAAQRHLKSQRIYVAVETAFGGVRYDLVIRLFWTDANRDRLFTLLGFLVNLDTMRETFAELQARSAALRTGDPRLEMRILDESGRLAFGPALNGSIPSARAPFLLQFYPGEDISSRLAAGVPLRRWNVVVSPSPHAAPALAALSATHGYWLAGLSVALIVIAAAFAVQGNKRASQLARMQAEFIAHVSHQLKTPLSLLSAATETVEMDRVRSPEKLAQYLEIMRTETARLSALVERILEFSRVQEQGRQYELESLNLTALVQETVEAFQRGLALAEFDIRVDHDGVSPVVRADPAAIEQALVNLLDNAVKYSDRVKQITVGVGRTTSEAVVSVADRGIGIAAADRDRIFERFFRGAGAGLHRHGFGLGLAIAQELVAAHRGRIEVESTPGHGSTFTIRLPLGASTLIGIREQPPPLAASFAEAASFGEPRRSAERVGGGSGVRAVSGHRDQVSEVSGLHIVESPDASRPGA